MPDVRLMKYFIAAVEERSITKAAYRLGIQQPPLSIQLKKLEDRVGAHLLKRIPSGVEPTPAGQVLYADFCELLEKLDTAVNNARRIDRGVTGKIILGITRSTISHPLTKEAINRFLSKGKDIAIDIVTDGSHELGLSINENRIDVAFIRPLDKVDMRLREDALVLEPMIIAAPIKQLKGLELGRGKINLKQLLKYKLILYRDSTDPTLYNKTLSSFDNKGLTLTNTQVTPSVNVALDLVSAGLGVSIVPYAFSKNVFPNIQYFDLSEEEMFTSSIVLATRLGETDTITLKFRRIVLECLGQ